MSDLKIFGSGGKLDHFVMWMIIDGLLSMFARRKNDIFHIGNEEELKISELAKNYYNNVDEHRTCWKPKGETERRCPETRRCTTGFKPQISIKGVKRTLEWYLQTQWIRMKCHASLKIYFY